MGARQRGGRAIFILVLASATGAVQSGVLEMPLQAYLDDSGTHTNDSPVCVAAGFFGGTYYWNQFSLEWDAAVRKRGLVEFHANKFWSGGVGGKTVGEYSGWSKEDCDSFLDELLAIIGRHRIWPVGSAFVAADWNNLTMDERRYLTGGEYKGVKHKSGGAPKQPYFMAFLFAVQNIAAYCGKGHSVDFIMDEGRTLGYALDYFKKIKSSKGSTFAHAHKLGTIKAGDSKLLPALQAADLLAHLTLRWTRENPVTGQEIDSDSPLGSAIRKARNLKRDFKLLGKVAFDRLLIDFRNAVAAGPECEPRPVTGQDSAPGDSARTQR
jgi:Protein of unknown function (DUF3800)